MTGSPPQVWGNLDGEDHNTEQLWFTPTGVGKSSSSAGGWLGVSVHPHRCGEILPSKLYNRLYSGSPPQVWGNPGIVVPDVSAGRFTPTGVGKSFTVSVSPPRVAVHPHRCGEIISNFSMSITDSGSPPQVWGNRLCKHGNFHARRFTPTGVGKSFAVPVSSSWTAVHPHRCGEIYKILLVGAIPRGSPPQVWGNHLRKALLHNLHRFTPTGVGKSLQASPLRAGGWVHPHRCGEISLIHRAAVLAAGSPPQVWGNLATKFINSSDGWFTPTGVGKSCAASTAA